MPTPEFDLGRVDENTKLQAKVIQGEDMYDTTGKTKVTDEIVTVKRMLGPLAQKDVDILRCVGLNYAKHSKSLSSTTFLPHLVPMLTHWRSQRSRTNSTSIPIHILQTNNNNLGPRR